MTVIQRKFDRLLTLTRERFDGLEHVLARQPLGLRVERFHWFEDGEHIPEDERPEDYLKAHVALMTDRALLGAFNDTHFSHLGLERFFGTLLGVGGSAPIRLTRTSENRFLVEVIDAQFQPKLQGARAELDFEPSARLDLDQRTPLLDEAFLSRSISEVYRYAHAANTDDHRRTDERWTLLDPEEYAVELGPGLWCLPTMGVRLVFDHARFRLTDGGNALSHVTGDQCGQLRLPSSTTATDWEERLSAHKTGDGRLAEALGAYIVERTSGRPPDAVERRIFAWQRFAQPF